MSDHWGGGGRIVIAPSRNHSEIPGAQRRHARDLRAKS